MTFAGRLSGVSSSDLGGSDDDEDDDSGDFGRGIVPDSMDPTDGMAMLGAIPQDDDSGSGGSSSSSEPPLARGATSTKDEDTDKSGTKSSSNPDEPTNRSDQTSPEPEFDPGQVAQQVGEEVSDRFQDVQEMRNEQLANIQQQQMDRFDDLTDALGGARETVEERAQSTPFIPGGNNNSSEEGGESGMIAGLDTKTLALAGAAAVGAYLLSQRSGDM